MGLSAQCALVGPLVASHHHSRWEEGRSRPFTTAIRTYLIILSGIGGLGFVVARGGWHSN